MFEQLKKDRQTGFGAQERLRLSLYVAALLALGGFIVMGATKDDGEKSAKPAAAPVEETKEVDPGPLLDADELKRRVAEARAAPERFAVPAIEYIRKIQRTGRLGPVQTRVTPAAGTSALKQDARGTHLEIEGRVVDVSREEYRPRPDASANERLWSVVIEGADGSYAVAVKHGRGSDFSEGAPVDAKPPLVRAETILPGQHVIVRGVYFQERTGTLGSTVLREPAPVVFATRFRIELPREERLAPISTLDEALWSDVQDRFNRESRNWEEDALFEVVQWARTRGYEAVKQDVLEGVGWKEWGKQTFETWKKEVAVDLDDPRPFTEKARGRIYRVSGIIAEVLQYDWDRVPRNQWGVDQFQLLTLISDHYRNVALRTILPYPITTFEGVEGNREDHLRIYGVFVKNLTYDTQFARPDGSGRPQPITVPMFVVLHAEPFPDDQAGQAMRSAMLWVAGAMVLLGLIFYVVLIRGGQKQADRMEKHRWELRRRARAAGSGATAGAPPESQPDPDPQPQPEPEAPADD